MFTAALGRADLAGGPVAWRGFWHDQGAEDKKECSWRHGGMLARTHNVIPISVSQSDDAARQPAALCDIHQQQEALRRIDLASTGDDGVQIETIRKKFLKVAVCISVCKVLLSFFRSTLGRNRSSGSWRICGRFRHSAVRGSDSTLYLINRLFFQADALSPVRPERGGRKISSLKFGNFVPG